MKIRLKFVSNSSSSSFICEVCGNVESGYDLSYEDVGYVCCEHGHVMCKEHILCNKETFKELYEENEELYYELPAVYCPVCQGKEVSRDDLVMYAYKKKLDEEVKKMIAEVGYEVFKERMK